MLDGRYGCGEGPEIGAMWNENRAVITKRSESCTLACRDVPDVVHLLFLNSGIHSPSGAVPDASGLDTNRDYIQASDALNRVPSKGTSAVVKEFPIKVDGQRLNLAAQAHVPLD